VIASAGSVVEIDLNDHFRVERMSASGRPRPFGESWFGRLLPLATPNTGPTVGSIADVRLQLAARELVTLLAPI
jgi:hypothetical protein